MFSVFSERLYIWLVVQSERAQRRDESQLTMIVSAMTNTTATTPDIV
jgi:hypothetical protein